MSPGRELDVVVLLAQAREGRPRAVARLISLVEGEHPARLEVGRAVAALTGRARVIGLTGPPGAGKSTATSALIGVFRRQGRRVGVLAVDPSSPFTGGALLGDRIRMDEHALDPGVFIRSMAGRGQLGGLAAATAPAVRVLDAAGFDVVLIETVGVGQSEVEVAALADTTVVLLTPGAGDAVQAAKAGILEVGDVFVVNKADRDGAATTARDLRHMIDLGLGPAAGAAPGWRPPVLRTVASTGAGIDELATALDRHHDWLAAGGGLADRRRRRAAAEIEALILAAVRSRLGRSGAGGRLDEQAGRVVAGELDPQSAADQLLAGTDPTGQGTVTGAEVAPPSTLPDGSTAWIR